MEKENSEYLVGKCLVSSPCMEDEPFSRSVIYVCSHTKDGAMGFIINKKIKEFSFADLAMQLPIDFNKPVTPIDLYQGGPLDKVRGFVLHSTDYKRADSIEPGGGVAISSSIDILTDIAFGAGPKDNIIALGYSNWAPSQLEQEIINNQWIVVPASPELVFKTKDEDKWQAALDSIGIDISRFSNICGRA
ncbi:MAG: YqgE/AlgH family protein [Alphaproteobacteria bacterium]|nr:YqgE/AlgH family protein [Alphaproteobacteria bacterium]